MNELYATLNLDPNAETIDIKTAYRRLSKALHPDRGGSAEEWEKLNVAYNVLSDPERRERYDLTGRVEPSKVTPARIREFLKQTLLSIIDRSKNRLDLNDNILAVILDDLNATRPGVQRQLRDLHHELHRAEELRKNFIPTGLRIHDDVVNSILSAEIDKVKDRVKLQQDMLELLGEVEAVLGLYSYGKAAPASEGQYETRAATARRRLGQG
jgi:curved DNA-binding protein CbpA